MKTDDSNSLRRDARDRMEGYRKTCSERELTVALSICFLTILAALACKFFNLF